MRPLAKGVWPTRMIRIALSLMTAVWLTALPAAAQEAWRATLNAGDVGVAITGDRYGIGFVGSDDYWLTAEGLVTNWNAQRYTCATMPSVQADLFFGSGVPGWEAHVIVDLIRQTDGSWLLDYPTIFFALIGADDIATDNWEIFDGDLIEIREVACRGDGRLLIDFDFKGDLTHVDKGTTLELRGTARAEFRLIDETEF